MSLFIVSNSTLIECNQATVKDLLQALCDMDNSWSCSVDEFRATLSNEDYNKCGWDYNVPDTYVTAPQTILYCIRTILDRPDILTTIAS